MKNTFQHILAHRQQLEQEHSSAFLFIDQFDTRLKDERRRESLGSLIALLF